MVYEIVGQLNFPPRRQPSSGRIIGMKTPDELVNADAKEPGGSWHVTLGGNGLPEVVLGPYENPATAEQDAAKIRAFLAALLASK